MRLLVHSLDVEVHGKDQVLRALAAYEAGPGDFADHPIGEINRAAGCSTTFTHDRGAGKVGSLTLLKA